MTLSPPEAGVKRAADKNSTPCKSSEVPHVAHSARPALRFLRTGDKGGSDEGSCGIMAFFKRSHHENAQSAPMFDTGRGKYLPPRLVAIRLRAGDIGADKLARE